MDNKQQILQVAEALIKEGGYNGFSFRSIAQLVGIKSASVHYHFPTKADLGAAVVRGYTDQFIDSLGEPNAPGDCVDDAIKRYAGAFRQALSENQRMCLCGLLGSEMQILPEKVAIETKYFFQRNLQWLTSVYQLSNNQQAAQAKAAHSLALLEGAVMMANALADIMVFDQAVSQLVD